jgi:plasmid stability protein
MTAKRKNRPRVARDPAADREVRLAVDLPEQLHRQLKARAAERGSSIRDYILELLRKSGIG